MTSGDRDRGPTPYPDVLQGAADQAPEDLPAEGTVVDNGLMAELEAQAGADPSGRPLFGPASTTDPEHVPLDTSDLLLEGESTDQHAMPAAPPDPAMAGHPGAFSPTAGEPGTEPLPAPSPPAGAPGITSPDQEPPPLTVQPTLIYRDPTAPSAKLLVVAGSDRGREFEIAADQALIGRGADNDIVLTDIAVSRQHLLVYRDGETFRVRDQGSGNGTILNGRRVAEALLADGDQVEIGKTLFRFIVTSEGLGPITAPAAGAAGLAAGLAATAAASALPAAVPEPLPSPSLMARRAAVAVEETLSITEAERREVTQAPVAALAAIKAPGAKQGFLATRRGKLLTFGLLGVLVVLVGAGVIKKVVLKRPAPVAAPQLPSPEKAYQDGVAKFREGDWDGAKAAFQTVLQQVPDFQGATKYVTRCDAEKQSHAQVETAKKALAEKRYALARAALKDVDPSSRAADTALELKRTITSHEVKDLVGDARRLLEGDNIEGAQGKIAAALALQPDNMQLVGLRNDLEKLSPGSSRRAVAARRELQERLRLGSPETPSGAAVRPQPERPQPGRTRPERTRPERTRPERTRPERTRPPRESHAAPSRAVAGGVSDKVAMRHYRNREWGNAIATLRSLAAKQHGRRKQKTQKMADGIRRLGQAFSRAESEQRSNPAQAIRNYEKAASIDRRIGKGAHTAYLKKKLSGLSRSEAQRALSSGRYEVAYRLLRTARRYGGEDAKTRAMSRTLDDKARELFERGYQMKGSRPDEAKGLWRRVLRMVPPNNKWYVKSYQYLNQAAGRRQIDEDE